MSLRTAIELVLEAYPRAITEDFAGNATADFVRKQIPEQIQDLLKLEERYKINGSAGQGNWARVPWVAIFDRFITETAQEGFYLVYLFREDYSGMFLSLNQGVTTVRANYGAVAKEALRSRAVDMLAQIGNVPTNYKKGPIDLKITSQNGLGADYECGSVCAVYYEIGSIPSDSQLKADLEAFLEIYKRLSMAKAVGDRGIAEEDDEVLMETEDYRQIRVHKQVERSRKLAQKVKDMKGYTCEACNFNFQVSYGDIGKDFIEAHHLTPISKLIGQKVSLHPEKDFAVLCSNCHRMIHKSDCINDVVLFRRKYLKVP